jgi:homoserine dehydrogenase
MSEPIGIALLGCGIVGSGVVKILAEQADLLTARTGLKFDIRHVVVRDPSKTRDLPPSIKISTDPAAAIDDPKVKIVIELIGGTTLAGDLMMRALKLGKPVITANKSLLAARGPELFSLAKQNKTAIAFEASCGGGIPIVDALLRGLSANRIDALIGIVNGTCNYILTRMTKANLAYADALKEAQAAGFAEADPTLDVSGRDAAQKLAVLASLAFGAVVKESDIAVEGIDTLDARDIAFAGDLGYVIKLLAIAERQAGGKISLRTHPTLVHKTDVLAEVSGSFNAISIFGHALGHALFYGRGAGQMPTASAVVADLLSVGLGVTQKLFEQIRVLPDSTQPVQVLPFDQLQSRYYLRLTALDKPGVMARLTDVLGKNGISLSAILQRETTDDRYVPIVITTHLAREGAMKQALAELDKLDVVGAKTVCLRVIDQPKEFASA